MKSRVMATENSKTFVVVLDPGEETLKALAAFAIENSIAGASLTAIGAFKEATVGWFDFEAKDYQRIPIRVQSEVLSAIGDVAEDEHGNPSVHIHVVLGLPDGSTRGGHLLDGIVNPTLEIVLVETSKDLRRRKRPDLGIALIDLHLTTSRSAPS